MLGFRVEHERPNDKYAFLSLGEAQLMLEQGNGNWSVGKLERPFGNGVNFQIETEDAENLARNIKAHGVRLFRDVFTSSYQCGDVRCTEREILAQDPDGYLLRFSQTQEAS